MADFGSEYTDRRTKELEMRISSIYRDAAIDIDAKLQEFTKKHKVKESYYLQQLKDGKITKVQFDAWERGQVFQGRQWQYKRDQILDVLYNANDVATKLINGQTNGVFYTNANFMAYSLEHGTGVNFGFGLYDASTVARLLKDNPKLLPEWKINEKKDYIWNKEKVGNQITQGIIQGEKLDQIAARLSKNLSAQNENKMKTFARTAMTGAQNAGRISRFSEAEKLGIKLEKEWMATLDGHTRDSHADIDGETVPINEAFSNGCMYPGDPGGPPAEVYNCRCTMVADLKDFPSSYKRYDNINGTPISNMTYREWERAKQSEYTDFLGIRQSLGNDFVNAMETLLNFTPEEDVKDLFYKYQDKLKVTDSKNSGDGAYYSPADGGVHINADKIQQGDDLHVPYQTVFHEFGHNIDYEIGPNNRYGRDSLARTYKNGILEKKIKEDWNDFRVQYLLNDTGRLENNLRSVLIDMANRENKYDPHNTQWYELLRQLRRGEVIPNDIISKHGDRLARNFLMDNTWKDLIDNDIIRSLDKEGMKLHERGSISDIIGGIMCSRGKNSWQAYPLGSGHQSDYWWTYKITKSGEFIKVSSGNLPVEFFAEVVDGKAANPDSLRQMRRVFPKSVKVVEQIIKEALQ